LKVRFVAEDLKKNQKLKHFTHLLMKFYWKNWHRKT